MLLTIVIPAYNEADKDRLPRLIEALRKEDLSRTRIVVVDDCSTDDTWKVIESAKEVRGFRTLRRTFCGGARNKGFWSSADSEYFWFLDGDCVLTPGAVAKVCDACADGNPDMVLFGINDYLPNGNALGASVTASSKAIRADLFYPFRTDWGYEDVDWWIRELDRCDLSRIKYIEETLVSFPDKRMSASIELFEERRIKAFDIIRNPDEYADIDPHTPASFLRVAAELMDMKMNGEIRKPEVARKLDQYLERHLVYVRRMFHVD